MPLARKDSGGNDDWGAATCYGRLEGTSPCRTAPPVFELAQKSPPKAVVPHQSGYQRLALKLKSATTSSRMRAPTRAPSSRRVRYGAVSG